MRTVKTLAAARSGWEFFAWLLVWATRHNR